MAARRCSQCGINYPTLGVEFMKCGGCGGGTDHINESDPDSDWQAQVDRINGVWRMPELPFLDSDHIVSHNGQTWIATEHLKRAGYYDPTVGDIIRVRGKSNVEMWFEIDGPALTNEQSVSANVSGWWIHRIEHEGWVPDAIPEA